MIIKNFSLIKNGNQQIIEIDYLGETFDLHNAAEFLKVDYTVKSALLTLFWNYYNDENKIIPFQIKFEGTSYFEILPRDIEIPNEEDNCLEQIIYNKNFEFKFMGGMRILINSDTAYFVV